jgi:tRNA modification GTPase
MEVGGIPVELIDTAGLRSSADEAEQLGIAKSHEAMVEADVVLLVLAANEPLAGEDLAALEATQARGVRALVVINKMDLSRDPSVAERSLAALGGAALGELGEAVVRTCALDGTGVAALREAILGRLRSTPPSADTAILTNLRQHQAVSAAVRSLHVAGAAVGAGTPHEMLLLDLYEALQALDGLTGTTTSDDMLNLIFSTFCIGK